MPTQLGSEDISDGLLEVLSKYKGDKYHSTPLANLAASTIQWCKQHELKFLNVLSSLQWRIFCINTNPGQAVHIKQVCLSHSKYTVLLSSTLSMLNFGSTSLCIVIPPGMSPRHVVSPWNEIQVIGCGTLIEAPKGTDMQQPPLVNLLGCSSNSSAVDFHPSQHRHASNEKEGRHHDQPKSASSPVASLPSNPPEQGDELMNEDALSLGDCVP